MSDTAPGDTNLEEWIGFPDPPHRIRAGQSPLRLMLGHVAATCLILISLGLLAGYFAMTAAGRSLALDTALAAGLGERLPAARVNIGACEYGGGGAGHRLPGQWTCTATVFTADRQTTVLTVETLSRFELRPEGAGRLFGETGIYWPSGILAARWWNASILLLIAVGLMMLAALALVWAAPDRRLMRARRGRIALVDLLTWKGRPHFAFRDQAGRTRFQRTDARIMPLALDGLCTRGAALVTGRSAVLLGADLLPLELPAEERAAILERAAQLRLQAQARATLAAQPGDPPTLMRRIERIENRVAAEPGKAELTQLYEEAWRLVWDSEDPAVSSRALHGRNTIAKLLGPRRAHAALLDCRRRYG